MRSIGLSCSVLQRDQDFFFPQGVTRKAVGGRVSTEESDCDLKDTIPCCLAILAQRRQGGERGKR